MDTRHITRTAGRCAAAAAGAGLVSYAGYVGVTWLRYGRAASPTASQADALLDRFMPIYDVVERHQIRVSAPADVTLAAAADMDFQDSRVIRAIFKGRELLLGSDPDTATRPRAFLALTKSLGWGALAEVPGREVVMGAVTKPWEANVVFRPIPAAEFAAFNEPGYVKIVWTLRADPVGDAASIFLTETRAVATDREARDRFRRYWSFLSPGILLIRRAMLPPLRAEAERRVREQGAHAAPRAGRAPAINQF